MFSHVIVEEAPRSVRSGPARPVQLVLLSARTETALARLTDRLVTHLEAHPTTNLADWAHTLRNGRTHLACRRFLTCDSIPAMLCRLPP